MAEEDEVSIGSGSEPCGALDNGGDDSDDNDGREVDTALADFLGAVLLAQFCLFMT